MTTTKEKSINIFFKQSILIGLFYLIVMTLLRIAFFLYYNANTPLNSELLESFFLGFRLDLTVVGYSYILPYLIALFSQPFKIRSYSIFKYYYFIIFVIFFTLNLADFGFYSYFKEHINILFFGLFDDDTEALIKTFWSNYHVVLILVVYTIFLILAYKIIDKIFSIKFKAYQPSIISWIIVFILIFAMIRGTFGMYPLGKMLPNISSDKFINQVAQNSTRSFIRAYELRQKFLSNHYDIIKDVGFDRNITQAFKIHNLNKPIDSKNLLKNITYTTTNVKNNFNVVVVMVESFGMPLLDYNSENFDILRSMKKHFKEDILFKNFISSGDGTIASLESLMLNITYRPNSFPLAQSIYKDVAFKYSPAFLYNKNGYETSFIYGGDLSWRDIGAFAGHQGYQHVEGKMDIYKNIKKAKDKECFHDWGIYDEFLFEHIEKKLLSAKKPQMVLAMTTNNHPPYQVPKQYHSKKLIVSDRLKKHLHGDLDLLQQRFYSYQYAVDQVGHFLDFIKKSPLKDNTIVVITADNNTIDGSMSYDNHKLLKSKNIPALFYLPKKLKETIEKIDTSRFGSHKDIFPTLYNLTLPKTSYLAIGNNLFASKGYFIGFNGSKVVASKEGVSQIDFRQKELTASEKFYKATLAVQEYLLNYYMKREKK